MQTEADVIRKDHTAKDLHKCTGCRFILPGSKCKIFGYTCAMMETLLNFRKCCFKYPVPTRAEVMAKVNEAFAASSDIAVVRILVESVLAEFYWKDDE